MGAWSKWHVVFADERFVPLDHKDSNYRACDDALFSAVTIPDSQVYKIDPDASNVAECAAAYETSVRTACGAPFLCGPTETPTIDMLLLGMGPDGHTLSLFPQHPLLDEHTAVVAPITDSPKPPPQRVTLTLPVCKKAREIVFVCTEGGVRRFGEAL
eukprot:gene18637-13591_t